MNNYNFITVFNDMELSTVLNGLGILTHLMNLLFSMIGIMSIIALVLIYKRLSFMFSSSEEKEKDEFFTGKIWINIPLIILTMGIFSYPADLKIRTVVSQKNIETNQEKQNNFIVKKGDYILEKGKVFRLDSTSEEVFGKDNWMSSQNTNYKELYGTVKYITDNVNSDGEVSFKLPIPIVFIFEIMDKIFNGSDGNNGMFEKSFGGLYYMLRVDPVGFFEILSRNGVYDDMQREELVETKINTFISNKGNQLSIINQNLAETFQLYNNIPYVTYIYFNSEIKDDGLADTMTNSKTNLANVLKSNNKYNKELKDFFRNEFFTDLYTPMIENAYTNNPIFTNKNDRKLYDKYFSTPRGGKIDYDKLSVDYGIEETPNQNVALFGKSTYLNIGVSNENLSNIDIINISNRINDFSSVLNLTEVYNNKEIVVPNAIYKKFLNTHSEQLISINIMDKIRTDKLNNKNIYSYLYEDLDKVENILVSEQLEGNPITVSPDKPLSYFRNVLLIKNNIDIYFKDYFPTTQLKSTKSGFNSKNLNEALVAQNKYIEYKDKMDAILEKYIKDLSLKMSNGNGNEEFYETQIRQIINNQLVYINEKFKESLEEIDESNDKVRKSLKNVIDSKLELEWARHTKKLKKVEINGDNLHLSPLTDLQGTEDDKIFGVDYKQLIFNIVETLFGWILAMVFQVIAFISKYAFALILSLQPLSIIMITFTVFFLIFKAIFTNNISDMLHKIFILVLNFYLFVFSILLASQLILSIAPLFLSLSVKFGRVGYIVEIIFIFFIFYFFSYVTKQITKMTGGSPFMNLFSGVNKVNQAAAMGVGMATIASTQIAGGVAGKGVSSGGKFLGDKLSGLGGSSTNPDSRQSPSVSIGGNNPLSGNNPIGGNNPLSGAINKSGQIINNTTINNNGGGINQNLKNGITQSLSDAINGLSEENNRTE